MADRAYTTKTRAKRIALEYFKRPHPFRRAKFLLSVALPAVAVLVLAGFFAFGDHRLYTSGPVTMSHAMFGAQCTECHASASAAGVRSSGTFLLRVSDRTCKDCHDASKHQEHEKFTPTCESCHFEHKGRGRLVDFGDRQCTQCHDNLATKGLKKDAPGSTFKPMIAGFQGGRPESVHPQFSVAQSGARARVKLDDPKPPEDTAQICLNHQVHLKPNIVRDAPKGMKGVVEKESRLTCTYCHQPDGQGAYMEPISYRKHCADCHPLLFDNDKFPDIKAPHDQPEIVHAFLRAKYTEFPDGEPSAKPADTEPAAEKPRRKLGGSEEPADTEPAADKPRRKRGGSEEPEVNPPPRRARPGGGGSEAEAKSQSKAPKDSKELEAFLKKVEARLFFKNKENAAPCQFCHTLLTAPEKQEPAASCGETESKQLTAALAALKDSRGNEKLPAVAKTAIPMRWLPHSRFDHRAHRMVKCTNCHQAEASKMTAEVLLPKIETCRECHADAGGARAACVECHLYHDKAKERDPFNGRLRVEKTALDGSARPGGGSR